ncbi:MAG: hypothetical protein Q7K29_05570 [Thermoleophilia bacterium]|nr:hypothetical protein [Thermoleophilia bacterium]
MLEYLQDHQKVATIISITVAVAVVIFLVLISGGNTPPSTGTSGYAPVVAHGQDGPVIPASQGGAAGSGGTATDSQDISQATLPGLTAEDAAGGWTNENTIFFDIDGDGKHEAIVLVRGNGESKPLDWRIYSMNNGATLLFERTRVAQGQVAVQGPMLVETEGVYADGDAACCPSSTKRTYFVWKGGSLVVSRVEAAPPLTAAP